ncbi:MAG TPA: hypothetical protein VMW83_00320 [Spirochaetia bacterium]|nr:hypothetical protein [Spirochaetia bacterium]
MLNTVAINVPQPLGGRSGERLRQSLVTLPGVKKVTVTYPSRVEVQYDSTETRAGNLMMVIRAHGLRTGLK